MNSFLLLQTGDYLLLQTGDKMLLNTGQAASSTGSGRAKKRTLRDFIQRDDDEVMEIVKRMLDFLEP